MARNISLKTRMALSVSLLFVVFSATIAYFSISYFEDKFKRSLADQQYALSCALADDIDNKLRMVQQALVAASSKVPPDITADRGTAQRFLDNRVTLHALCDTTLFLLDKDGMMVAESPVLPDRQVFNLAHREYYRQTIATGKPVISTPYPSSLPGHRPVIMLTAPVFDSRGKLSCILCGGLRLLGTNFLSDVQQTKIGTTGYIFLTTSDRTMIMHPDSSRIMTSAAAPGVNKLFDRTIAGFNGSGETVTSQGIPMLASYRHLRTTDWILGLNFPIQEAYAPMYRTRQFLLGGIAAGTLAMLVIVWFVMRRLTLPLQAITRHVAELPEKGGEDKLIAFPAGDEIGTLAQAFNGMVKALDSQQQALRESEHNFRSLAEAANDGMLVITGSGSFVFANCRIAGITGYSDSELIRLGIRDLAHPDDYAHLMERVAGIIGCEDIPRQYETRMIRKDGSEVPVEVTSSLTLWQGEAADLAIVRDISERRRAEKALRDSHTLLQKTFASLNEAVFIVETGTRVILDCNITVEKMFGYSRDEMVGLTTSCLHLTEEMSQRFGSDMLKSYAEKGYFETTFKMQRKDGSVFDSEHYVTPIRDENGVITSHVCVVRDISERMRGEEALRGAVVRAENEKARTEAVIAAIGEGIIIQDREFRILYQNDVHRALIGDHHGEFCFRVYQGRDGVCEDCPAEMAFRDGSIHRVEKTTLSNGRMIDIDVTASPLRDVTGEIVACIEMVRDITERKQIEELLKKQMAAIETSIDGIAILDRNAAYTYLNQAHARIYGYDSPAELIGKSWRDMYGTDEIQRFEQDVLPVFGEKARWRGEAIGRRRDGSTFPQEVSLSMLEGGGIICVVRDITERKHADERLRKSEKHFAEAQKVAHVGSWEVDVATGKITWSQEMFNVTGRDPRLSEPTYEELMQLIHPDDRQALADCMKAASTEGRPYQLDSRRIAPDGSIRYMSALGKPIFDDAGKIVRLFGTVMDITEHQLAEERLKESEARFRAIFEGARDAVFIADIETGIILDANDEAEKLLGRPKRDIICTHHTALHPPENLEYSSKTFEEHIRSDGAVPFYNEIVTADNRRVPVEINASLIRLMDGKKVMLGIFRNITERRRAEEEIKNLNTNLQRRAADLAVANTDLEAFGYSLSHDLKGPLTAIYSAAQTLEYMCAELVDDNGRFCIDTIIKASERMEELLDAMLLLSRISRSELELEVVDLSTLAMDNLLRLQLQERDRVVEHQVASEVMVMGDSRLLKSALENLLGNAWKYTRKEAVTRIEFGMTTIDGEKAFFVRDNGVGFDMKHAAKMFMPFHRLHRDKDFEGMGIGLTTVQRIIHRHGGRLWGEGEPGDGATFYFTLPEHSN